MNARRPQSIARFRPAPGMLWTMLAFAALAVALPDTATAKGDGGVLVVEPRPEEIVESSLDEVLSSRELRHLRGERTEVAPERSEAPQWLEDFFEWLFGRKSSGGGADSSLFGVLRVALYVVVFAVVFVVVLLIARAVVERGSLGAGGAAEEETDETGELDTEGPPGELPPEFYLERANDFASASNWRAAVREVLLAAMSWTERRGLVRYRRGITNRGYLRALHREKNARESFARVAGQFEVIFYGRRAATERRYTVCCEAFEEAFGAQRSETTPAR